MIIYDIGYMGPMGPWAHGPMGHGPWARAPGPGPGPIASYFSEIQKTKNSSNLVSI